MIKGILIFLLVLAAVVGIYLIIKGDLLLGAVVLFIALNAIITINQLVIKEKKINNSKEEAEFWHKILLFYFSLHNNCRL